MFSEIQPELEASFDKWEKAFMDVATNAAGFDKKDLEKFVVRLRTEGHGASFSHIDGGTQMLDMWNAFESAYKLGLERALEDDHDDIDGVLPTPKG